MRTLVKSLTLTTTLLFAGQSLAFQDRGVEYDYAQVISVDPIVETVSEPIDRQVCRDEPVEVYQSRHVYQDRRHRDPTGGTILGALIGGALGNTVGRGDGRRAATIAGAVIGGAIGHDNARRGRYVERGGSYHTRYESRCHVETDYTQDERVIGYDVAYRYNGRVYHTQTDHHPGDRIRVEVQVQPAF